MKTIQLAIVDDEPIICDLLEHYARMWFMGQSAPYQIDTFTSAEAFSFEWETSRNYDVIFLDIQMKGASGIVLAKQIRNLDKWTRIIFVTGISDYVYEGYEVSAMNYLLKPVSKEKIFSSLEKAYEAILAESHSPSVPMVVLEWEGQTLKLAQKDILYVEAQKNYICVQTLDAHYTLKSTFSNFSNSLLPELFVKPHRSYLVGLDHIKAVNAKDLLLDNGTLLPLSRSQRQEVYQDFIHYYKNLQRKDT